MHRILPVPRVLLFVSLSLIVAAAASGCGLKGDLVLPEDGPGAVETSAEQASRDGSRTDRERDASGTGRG